MIVPEVKVKVWLETGLHTYTDKVGLSERLTSSVSMAMGYHSQDRLTEKTTVRRVVPDEVEITQIAKLASPCEGTLAYIEIAAHPHPDRMERMRDRLGDIAVDFKHFLGLPEDTPPGPSEKRSSSGQVRVRFVAAPEQHEVSYG